MPIAALSTLERVFVIGSFLRKDHPLFALRIRQAARRGGQVMSLHAVHDDWAMPVAHKITAAPSAWAQALADVAAAVAEAKGVAAPVAGERRRRGARRRRALLSGERKAILLGNAAAQHPQAGTLLALAHWIAEQCGATVGFLGEAANSVGAQLGARAAGADGSERRADAVAADEGAAAAERRARARCRRPGGRARRAARRRAWSWR